MLAIKNRVCTKHSINFIWKEEKIEEGRGYIDNFNDLRNPKGVSDIKKDDYLKYNFVFEKLKRICHVYGFDFIKTSLLMHKELVDNIEASKDKTYDLYDKKNRVLTLCPDSSLAILRHYKNYYPPESPRRIASNVDVYRYNTKLRGFTQFCMEYINYEDQDYINSMLILITKDILDTFAIEGKFILNDFEIWDYLLKEANNPNQELYNLRYSKNKIEYVKNSDQISIKKQEFICFIINNNPRIEETIEKANELNLFFVVSKLEKLIKNTKYLNIENFTFDLLDLRGSEIYDGFYLKIVNEQNIPILDGGCYHKFASKILRQNSKVSGIALCIEALFEYVQTPEMRKVYIKVLTNSIPIPIRLLNTLRKELHDKFDFIYEDVSSKKIKKAKKTAYYEEFTHFIVIGDSELDSKSISIEDLNTNNLKKINLCY